MLTDLHHRGTNFNGTNINKNYINGGPHIFSGHSETNGVPGNNSHSSLPTTLNSTNPLSENSVIRNPRLFYEKAFIARPKLILEKRNGFIYTNGGITVPSTTGNGSSTTTLESLKGSLRKDSSIDRKSDQQKKRVQFDLANGHSDNGFYGSEDTSSRLSEEEEEDQEFTDIEKSLMQGYSEYGLDTATENHVKKKPELCLDFGFRTNHVKADVINTELPLAQQTWYFGTISRQEAEDILRNCREGCYIVRSCELNGRRDYSLAIKSSCGFMHLKIHRQEDDLYRLADFNRVFLAVPDLIEYYSSEKIPIRGAEYMILLHPVHQQLL